MKKLLLSLFVGVILMSCGTTTVNQIPVYGTVEDIIKVDNYHRAKVWCEYEGKYYNIKTEKLYQIGDVIRIK